MLKKYVFVAFILFLSACAYSPQQITISPVVAAAGDSYGRGLPIQVAVEDQRANKVLGTRGGVYRDTSTISVSNDISEAITQAATAKLAAQGFSVNNAVTDNAAELKIIVDKLVYDVPADKLDKKIYLQAVLLAEATYQGASYSGRYKTNNERVVLITPNAEKNQQMINELLSETLERLFADAKLQAFLVER